MNLVELLTRWDVLLVFFAVLLEQGGLPLPAAPILVSAGALAQTGVIRPEQLLLAAFAAGFIADQIWFHRKLIDETGGRSFHARGDALRT